MKTEVSAGGIVVRTHRGDWDVLLVQDMNDVWTFPKGLVEKTEDYEGAAVREIREEVGLTHLKLLTKLPLIRYMYQKDGLISKTVHYFLFHMTGTQKIVEQKEEGIHYATWKPIDDALKIIGYPETNKPLLTKTKQWILNSRLT